MLLSCTHCGLQFFTHTSIKLLIDIRFEIFTIIIAILMIFFYSSTDLIQFMVVDCIVYTVIKPSHCNLCYIVSVLMSAAILIMFFLWYEFTPHYIFKMDNTVCHKSFHTGKKHIQYNFFSIIIMLFMQFSYTKYDLMGSTIHYDYKLIWRIEM